MQRIKKITAIILSVLTLSSVCVFGSSFSAGAKGTGAGLAEWALNAYNSGWSYVYGGSTPGAVDCSGLIYSYAGGERCGNPQLETATETGSVSVQAFLMFTVLDFGVPVMSASMSATVWRLTQEVMNTVFAMRQSAVITIGHTGSSLPQFHM